MKGWVTHPHVLILTTRILETAKGMTKTKTISRKRICNQMKIPSPASPRKYLINMSSILTPTLLNKFD